MCTGSNTYLLGRGPSRILLDTGEGFPSWKQHLSDVLKSESATVTTCLLSHWHHDHIGGTADFQTLCPSAKIYKNNPTLNPDGILKPDHNVFPIADGQTFAVPDNDSFAVKAVHCPGHTTDHMAFVITASADAAEQGAMFTGDNVLGHGTAVFEDLAVYLASLHTMATHIKPGVRAYPAHGAVLADGRATIDMYIAHRQQREDEALRVLRTGRASEGESGVDEDVAREWESMEMVKVIYKDVPENLHVPAEMGLVQVLKKLEGEGKVVNEAGKWRLGGKSVL